MNELTQEDKNLLLQVIAQLNLPVAQAEVAVQLKQIALKLQPIANAKEVKG